MLILTIISKKIGSLRYNLTQYRWSRVISGSEAARTTGVLLLLLGIMLLGTAIWGRVLGDRAWSKLLVLGFLWLAGGLGLRFLVAGRWFSVVGMGWLSGNPFLMASYCFGVAVVLGSIPYWLVLPGVGLGGALFESVAGFTGTAASLFSADEELSEMLIWWRGSSQWLGGMGTILLIQGLLPLPGFGVQGGSNFGLGWQFNQVLRWVLPVYVGGTLCLALLLKGTGLSVWEAGVYAMGTLSTGGLLGRLPADLGTEGMWLLSLGMCLGGMNFILLGLVCWRRWWAVSIGMRREWFWYVVLVVLGAVFLMWSWSKFGVSLEQGIREGFFHAASMLSTTGYSHGWGLPGSSFMQALSLLLMWVGACTASGGSGVRWQRVILMGHNLKRGMLQILHPAGVWGHSTDLSGDDSWSDLGGVLAFLLLHLSCWLVLSLLLTLDGHSALGALASILSVLNNVGPAFTTAEGAKGLTVLAGWESFSSTGITVAITAMLIGKLEVVTLCILFLRRGTL